MLAHEVHDGVNSWSSPDGEMRVWYPAPHVLVHSFRGKYYSREFAQLAVAAFSRFVETQNRPDLILDWEGMESYATEARTESTTWVLQHRRQLNSITILTRSKLVRMGVSMANLVLGGLMRLVDSRTELEEVLRRAVSRGA